MSDFKKFASDITKTDNAALSSLDKKENRIKKFRKEVSRKASIANKRLKRLEEQGMTTAPAYEKWQSQGGEYFSIRGKSYNEVQSELARINSYLDSVTSTVSGAKRVVKEMMENTGLGHQWSDWQDMKKQTKNFFEIASKVEQYLRTVEDMASSVSYQRIWEAINQYTQSAKQDLDVSTDEIDRISADIAKAMKVWNEPDIHHSTTGYDIWVKLPKF